MANGLAGELPVSPQLLSRGTDGFIIGLSPYEKEWGGKTEIGHSLSFYTIDNFECTNLLLQSFTRLE